MPQILVNTIHKKTQYQMTKLWRAWLQEWQRMFCPSIRTIAGNEVDEQPQPPLTKSLPSKRSSKSSTLPCLIFTAPRQLPLSQSLDDASNIRLNPPSKKTTTTTRHSETTRLSTCSSLTGRYFWAIGCSRMERNTRWKSSRRHNLRPPPPFFLLLLVKT